MWHTSARRWYRDSESKLPVGGDSMSEPTATAEARHNSMSNVTATS